MQPDPVVKPGKPKSRMCTTAGRSPMPLTTRRAIDAPQQAVEIRVLPRIVAHHRVFDRDGHAVAHQAADGVEPRVLVRAEAVLGLQVEDERHAGGVGNLANARLEAARVARVAARQHHRGPERDAAAAAAPDRSRGRTTVRCWGSPSATPGTREPAEQRLELVERDVVEEGVAAVEQPGDAAGFDVPRHAFGGVEVERAASALRLRGSGGTEKTPARSSTGMVLMSGRL